MKIHRACLPRPIARIARLAMFIGTLHAAPPSLSDTLPLPEDNDRSATMVADKFDFGFAVDWMRKDLGICLAEARRNGAHLPVTALVDQFYSEVQKMGGGRFDTSSLIKRLNK